MTTKHWNRCTRNRRCPICDHPEWCLVTEDGAACICMRIAQNSTKEMQCGDAGTGYLHRLRDDPNWQPRPRSVRVRLRLPPDARMDKMARDAHAALSADGRAELAALLGVSAESLERLRAGWSAQHNAYTFPMSVASGGIVGIRLRRADGSKFSVPGGHEGIFVPTEYPTTGSLLIAEGPTDTAALLDLGFAAIIGRPSCTGGTRIIKELVRARNYSGAVIVADADAPGERGADSLASSLRLFIEAVRIITPPSGIKDAREWKRRGATKADVEAAIAAAPLRTVKVRGVAL